MPSQKVIRKADTIFIECKNRNRFIQMKQGSHKKRKIKTNHSTQNKPPRFIQNLTKNIKYRTGFLYWSLTYFSHLFASSTSLYITDHSLIFVQKQTKACSSMWCSLCKMTILLGTLGKSGLKFDTLYRKLGSRQYSNDILWQVPNSLWISLS